MLNLEDGRCFKENLALVTFRTHCFIVELNVGLPLPFFFFFFFFLGGGVGKQFFPEPLEAPTRDLDFLNLEDGRCFKENLTLMTLQNNKRARHECRVSQRVA